MLRNYFVLFFRNLLRQKLFSSINLLGLTVSIASTLLIYIYVNHEFSYDKFHNHSDRLYRVNQTFIWGENSDTQFSRTGPGVAHALKEELEDVEMVTSLHTPGSFIISYTGPDNQIVSFEETEVLSADSNFFKVLNFPLIKGNTNSAFRNVNTLMLTESTARKYFGDSDPLGKMVRVGIPNNEKTETYEVTGVVKNVPSNSTIKFDVLLSSKNFNVERMHWSWVWTQLETFVLLRESADIRAVREKLVKIPEKRVDETLRLAMNTTYKDYVASGKRWELFLQPITTLHMPEYPVIGSFNDLADIKLIYSLIGAAIFIMFLSCINFMNLSTAQFTRRVKEAGVRKILGLGRAELGTGYFAEALIFCLIALVAAVAITQIILPVFNTLVAKNLKLDFLATPAVGGWLILIVIVMAAVSSFYPSLFLSSFRPTEAVKGRIKVGKSGSSFRNGLVVFQFTVSIVLIACTGVVFQQLKFFSEKDLGFDRENVMRIKHVEGLKNSESLVKALENIPGVIAASRSSSTPPEIYEGDSFSADGMNGQTIQLNYTSSDERFVPTLGINLKLGRNFSVNSPSDVHGILLNEAAIKKLGWPVDESVLGRKILYPNNSESKGFEILGVVEDFNYWSLAMTIEPMGIFHVDNKEVFNGPRRFVSVRLKPQDAKGWQRISKELETTWRAHAAGGIPFEFGFIDDYFAETFKTQERFGYVLIVVATLAIIIASLGLLGMIIYALEQRTKEIGIRKVSGASSWNILSLISGSYLKLVLAAFIIGSPISYYLMKAWLDDFSYRISPSPWIFLLSGLSILIIASLITSYHSLKAARRNPVEVLRDE
jgi:putative ABC transport system permease protein